jgi:alkanesulfonate monooxygenase SsuD/methylene tetrahydromethanopterin reductase-like flavin-dependent oxidoreductase (luciferase family)
VILPLQHPLSLAEDVATLDVLSGGRVQMGVALGYRDEENEAFGYDPHRRVSRFEESLEIIERLWTGEPVTFSGQHFQMKDVRISCRPAQRPRPMIGIGASAEKGIRRAARLGLRSMSFRVQWPGMENAQVLRSIRLLGEQVLPHL